MTKRVPFNCHMGIHKWKPICRFNYSIAYALNDTRPWWGLILPTQWAWLQVGSKCRHCGKVTRV